MFLSDENRLFFLRRYAEILSPFINTYCWCLLPNHFHFLIRIKTEGEIHHYLNNPELTLTITEKKFLKEQIPLTVLIEKSFTRFFQSYAQAFNKSQERLGNLFYKPFKRVLIKNDHHFTQTIIYVHANPVKHKISNDFTSYKWSSWKGLLSNKPTNLLRNEMIEWFGNKDLFIEAHQKNIEYYYEDKDQLE